MIPKIIHFCWLSNDAYPEKIKKCINSWDKHLDGYEIWLWDFNRFPKGKSAWVDQAFEARKYAFAADYIRAYALYHHGGIYLDSDVEVLKNFDDFLRLPYMLGLESDSGKIEAAVMGAEKGNQIFKALLDFYDSNNFIKEDGTMDILPLPSRLDSLMNEIASREIIDDISKFGNDNKFYVFTSDFFSPIHIINLKLEISDKTVAIHHFAATWKSPYHRFKKRIQKIIGPKPTLLVQRLKKLIKR